MSGELELFEGGSPDTPSAAAPTHPDANAPLAARMRPRSLDEFRGQEHLLGHGRALSSMLEGGSPSSLILWGPPGSGKTTLARLVAAETETTFVPFSAVTEGIARVREIIAEAGKRLRATGRRTVLFCDEIHRFNKAQQDAFLPHVEDGTVILIGATTENPSFEIIRPLLSRAPVFVLEALGASDLLEILRMALTDDERGLGALGVTVDEGVLERMAEVADGDARRALGVLEAATDLVGPGGQLTAEAAQEAAQHRSAVYDKSGEEHYNQISALHKAVRGSDPDGALYWLARMLTAGEDPMYLARRLVRMAVEDIGLADPGALAATVAARDAYHFLGSPEGDLALAQATLRLATAPKSNRAYLAWRAASSAALESPGEPVPLHLRNAPTDLMQDLGYGREYRYDPDEEGGVSAQAYLPPALHDRQFYRPGSAGFEQTIAERLARFAKLRTRTGPVDGSETPADGVG